jgi:hypothetical protein
MRLFQNSGIYPGYRPRLAQLVRGASDFRAMRAVFLADRYGACHFLKPVLDGDESAFFTNGDDEALQRRWAAENGLRAVTPLADILLAQIEQHRSEVFYNLDPMRYGSDFVRRLPGCVKHTIAWRAAPSPGADFAAYDRVVCNFPGILQGYRERGWKAAYFAPAHDPVMDRYAAREDRPIDVLFVGGYSRHHRQRAETLQAVAALGATHNVRFHLDRSRLTRLAESPPGRLLPLAAHRRPAVIRRASAEPVFGLALYEAISRAKIVLNGAVDMAGADRGNMRCFEAMGCGALMVSDAGHYPEGMEHDQTLMTYGSDREAAALIAKMLADTARASRMARAGHEMVRTRYGKQHQWAEFQRLIADV